MACPEQRSRDEAARLRALLNLLVRTTGYLCNCCTTVEAEHHTASTESARSRFEGGPGSSRFGGCNGGSNSSCGARGGSARVPGAS